MATNTAQDKNVEPKHVGPFESVASLAPAGRASLNANSSEWAPLLATHVDLNRAQSPNNEYEQPIRHTHSMGTIRHMRERKLNTHSVKLTEYATVESFKRSQTLHNGYLSVSYNNYPIDLNIRKGTSGTMVVVFHAALMGDFQYPVFHGLGILKDIDVTRVSISDPTIGQTELSLAWYAGNRKQPDLQSAIYEVVMKLSELADAPNVVFFGASGGGFAALQMSRLFNNSLALPINPQTSINNYLPAATKRYLKQAWAGDSIDAISSEHNLNDLYEAGSSNTVGYIQNRRDLFHIRNHESLFLSQTSALDHAWSYGEEWGSNPELKHVPPPKETIREILNQIQSCSGDWETGLRSVGFTPARNRLEELNSLQMNNPAT